MEKKNLTIRFDLSIPRQKLAYEILMNEKSEKGIPHNIVVHEALELYALKHQKEPDSFVVNTNVQELEASGKKNARRKAAAKEQNPETATAEPSYGLAEDELDDPYLLEQLGALYSDEQ